MPSLTHYRPYRFPRYPGRISTISRAQLTAFGQMHREPGDFMPHAAKLHGHATSLLIIESDVNRSRALEALLGSWGVRTITRTDHAFDSDVIDSQSFDLVLLNGFVPADACMQLVATAQSIGLSLLIFATDWRDFERLEAICCGNSRIIQPDWRAHELQQAINLATGRRAECAAQAPGDDLYAFSGWTLDLGQHLVVNDRSEIVMMSAGEFSLLRAFVLRPRRVLNRNQLLDIVTTMGSDITDRVIDTQICRLRRRLAGDHHFIRTIRNEGYMFTEPVRRVSSPMAMKSL
ncbi:two-component system, OmpR family, response regulator [Sphingobium sp. AP50]|uniref:winged helix family transcriptional regulator n=1 Tax=Sphingobium sp. AP50 TaxID=1884369 RepID=UPI0008BE6E44|nr:winged helix-turn-helix domain-containing protein [Sphingobium sp. AP50]SEI84457.1 two-component system, OmpR family, response regulator [Sphingobium sp. AP50]